MAWIFADRTAQGDQTGSYTNLSSSFQLGASGSNIQTRNIDAPPEHNSFYSRSIQSQIKHIQSKVGGQEVTSTSSPTFQNMTVTGSLRAGAFVVTSSQLSYTASFGTGRSIFGDTPDDLHSLTGSLSISGGLEVLHYDLSGSNESSMSIGQFVGTGSTIQNVQVPQSDFIPRKAFKGTVTALQLPSGSRSTQPPGQRGLIAGGGSDSVDIYFVTISTPADALDFGDLTDGKESPGATSNGVHDRGVAAGGYPFSNIIDYVTISTAANAIDFGDLISIRYGIGGVSNGPNERAVFMGGAKAGNEATADIDYITISTPGNANDFGDLINTIYYCDGTDNGVRDRGVIFGGKPAATNIEFVTISTTGNAHDFGDLTSVKAGTNATSNDINDRGVTVGDEPATNVIEMITIPTPGNASDFGDLTRTVGYPGATSNGTDERGIFSSGNPANNVIDYITISVPGNALDFGALPANRNQNKALSNAAVPIWPHENAFDQIKLYTSASAATALADRTEQTNFTGSYLSRFSGSASHPLHQHSGSSQTFVEEIASGSLTLSSNRPPGNIGVFAYGATGIDFFQINSPGNAVDFGSTSKNKETGMSNGILGRGITADVSRTLRYSTLTTPGAAFFFGNIGPGRINDLLDFGGTSNGPLNRGMMGMGYIDPSALGRGHIEYITISTLADSLHFGDSSNATRRGSGLSNGVGDRAVFFGGDSGGSHMSVFTVSTPSDGVFFGKGLSTMWPGGLSNDTGERGIQVAGGDGSPRENTIRYITLTSFGEAHDFGDTLTDFRRDGVSNGRGNRAVMGASTNTDVATMEYLTINTPGNSIDFGDLTDSNGGTEGYGGGMDNGQSFYPHAAYPQTRFSIDPMTVVQSKTEVSIASGSLQHYIASGGLFSIPIITPSASSADGPQSGSNSFVNNFPEGAIGRTGVFEVWTGLVPDQVTNLSGSSPAFTQLALGLNATGSIGTLHGFSGSSAFYASASIYNAYNVSASFTSGSSVTSDSASAGRIAAVTPTGTNTIYRGEWKTIASGSVLPGQRGCFGQGGNAEIDYVTISTLGNALHFGDGLVSMQQYMAGTDSGTNDRGFLTLGRTTAGADVNRIEMITISTPSNTVDYGDAITLEGRSSTALSNGPNDRAVLAQDEDDSKVMEFFSMRSFGNAIFFGNLQNIGTAPGSFSNGTDNRGIIAGGYNNHDEMEFINILSTGDASFFGNMVVSRNYNPVGASSNDHHQRGFIAGGHNARDEIDYVDIATLGNALAFGDISAAGHRNSSLSNGMDERGLIQLAAYNTVEFITISTPGNTTDFGDIRAARQNAAPMANSFTPPAISGSSMSVSQTFLSSSIMHGSGSGAIDLPRNGFTGAVSASNHASASYIEVTSRIMNTTGSGADASSSLLDFTSRSPGQRTVTGFNSNATDKNLLDAITMTSLGNAAVHGFNHIFSGTFIYGSGLSNGCGDRAIHRHNMGAAAMQCISISTPGNAGFFGNRSLNNNGADGGLSNGTDQRGVFGLSQTQLTFITISTLGNAATFGRCTGTQNGAMASNGRNQRGITFTTSATRFRYFTISSLGNALDFGDGTTGGNYGGAASNDTNDRLVHHPVNSGAVEYITISTPSDALDFGNSIFGDNGNDSFSNGTGGRGFNIGDDGAEKATIAFYDIGNTGDSQIFGDLSQQAGSTAGFAGSNSAL